MCLFPGGLKRSKREADHSFPFSVAIYNYYIKIQYEVAQVPVGVRMPRMCFLLQVTFRCVQDDLILLQSNPYALKDGSSSADMSAWTSAGLQPTTGYYPYDPALAAYG